MGKDKRYAYLKAVKDRYRQADKKSKTIILNEFCQVCRYNRKYAIRLLNQKRKRIKRRRPGRKPVYHSVELLRALKRIWLATDQMCSKKLVAAISLWLPFYEKNYEAISETVMQKLLSISAATIDRLLLPIRIRGRGKGLGGTKPGSLLRNQIPIRTHNWDITQPGFMEADTVAHCGRELRLESNFSQISTAAWTECRATWNNGAQGVIKQIKDIEINLAFPLKGFAPPPF